MFLDVATDAQIRAARILIGATMVGFLAAPIFRRRAQSVRLIVACLYIVGVVTFIIFILV
jgi:hypothetical protein